VSAQVSGRAVVDTGGADEHPGTAAAQCARVDTGTFEGLPGGLQQQSLLGVHGQRLPRRDAEELGVEVRRAGQETAFGRGAAIPQGGEVPTPVGGEGPDRVPPLRDQAPEIVGTGHTTGITARHADNDHRITDDPACLGSRRGAVAEQISDGLVPHGFLGRVGAEQVGDDAVAQGLGGGVVEHGGGGQGQAGGRDEAVTQLDGGQ
jgi:hypothetical protein